MKNKRGVLIRIFILLLSVSFLFSAASNAIGETKVSFIRMDRDNPNAWKGRLDNVRLLTGKLFEFHAVNTKYGIAPDYRPISKGLDTLCISGSAQFSDPQFRILASTLRECAGGRTVYVIDLRQESHVLVNEGIPVSWYGSHNWSNAGMTAEAIEADESERFDAMIGGTIAAYARKDDTPVNETIIRIQSVMTERELVESEGFKYLRLPIRDHTWPTAEEIDAFISFVKSVDSSRVWLHFHCQAGKGRTGIMMMLYDMMMNPDVPMRDIVVRQTMLGGSYPLYTEDSDNYKVPYYAEKARMTPLFYEYVQRQQPDFNVPWSVWLAFPHS